AGDRRGRVSQMGVSVCRQAAVLLEGPGTLVSVLFLLAFSTLSAEVIAVDRRFDSGGDVLAAWLKPGVVGQAGLGNCALRLENVLLLLAAHFYCRICSHR